MSERNEAPFRKRPDPEEPARIVSLQDLCSRSDETNRSSVNNQGKVNTLALAPNAGAPISMAILAGFQLVAGAIYHSAIALCERLDHEDAAYLIAKAEKLKGPPLN